MVNMHQIPLAELLINERAVILSFSIGRPETNRLVSLGFTPGTKVDMTQNYRHGPVIVTIRGTRVALGRSEAAKILVERNPE